MKITIYFFVLVVSFKTYGSTKGEIPATTQSRKDSIPAMLAGAFKDDYGIRYTISDSIWTQSGASFHIIKWNTSEQYLIARNDVKNKTEPGLYTRIDYMAFSGMEPYHWGFCYTVYDAKSDSIAETTARADRQNPKKGCNGFPFSRMERTQ